MAGNVDVPMNGGNLGAEEVKGSQPDAPCDAASVDGVGIRRKALPIDSIFVLQEQDIVDSYNDSFMVSWRTISQMEEFRRTSTQTADQLQAMRAAAKNLLEKK